MTGSLTPQLDRSGPIATLQAPDCWQRIELLSDLHLSEATPRTVEAFLHRLKTSEAAAILLLGDIFEVWVGDDAARQAGFERHLLTAMAEASQRRWIGFMPGNRDFLVGPEALAMAHAHALPDPVCLEAWGSRWLLTHGDALCLDDTDYQTFRQQVRSPAWQAGFLAQPLAQRIDTGRRMREASEARKAIQAPESYADVDPQASAALMAAARSTVLIHGHTHRPTSEPWGAEGQRHVLSDWDLDGPQARGDVLELSAAGSRRHPVIAPHK